MSWAVSDLRVLVRSMFVSMLDVFRAVHGLTLHPMFPSLFLRWSHENVPFTFAAARLIMRPQSWYRLIHIASDTLFPSSIAGFTIHRAR